MDRSLDIDADKEKQVYQLLGEIAEVPRLTQNLGKNVITWGRIIATYGKDVKVSQKTFTAMPETPEIITYLMEKVSERVGENGEPYNRCTAFLMNKPSDAVTSLCFDDVPGSQPAEILCFGGGTR